MSKPPTLVKIGNSPNWFVQWFEAGHSRRRTTGTSDKAEAEAFLASFKLAQAEAPTDPQSLSDVLEWYLQTRGPEISDPGRARYAIDHLVKFYGASMAEDVSLPNQRLYAEHRRSEGVGNETIRRELVVLSAALNLARAEGLVERTPAILSLPASAPRDRYLTRDEAARLLRHMHAEDRADHLVLFTRLALFTGARTGAILDLTWDRVHLARRAISYPVPGRALTSKRAADVPLSPNLVRALRAAKKRTNSPYVISFRGEPCKRIIVAFRRHARAVGLTDVTPHTLRHTFASWAAMKGESFGLIGTVLGQANVSTTARYAKMNVEATRRVVMAVWRK